MIEEVHEGAVGDQRHNALRFVAGELEAADPAEDDDKPQAEKTNADAVQI